MLKGWQNMPSHSVKLAQAMCPGTSSQHRSLAPSKLLIKVSLLPHVEADPTGGSGAEEELRTWLLNETCFPGNDEIHVT